MNCICDDLLLSPQLNSTPPISRLFFLTKVYFAYYRPQRSSGKVMFLHVSVILFGRGGGVCPLHAGIHPLGSDTPRADPPRTRHPLSRAPRTRHPPAQCMLGDTGNKQAVHILLECNLVTFLYIGEEERQDILIMR